MGTVTADEPAVLVGSHRSVVDPHRAIGTANDQGRISSGYALHSETTGTQDAAKLNHFKWPRIGRSSG
jgi:hypothetical protein